MAPKGIEQIVPQNFRAQRPGGARIVTAARPV